MRELPKGSQCSSSPLSAGSSLLYRAATEKAVMTLFKPGIRNDSSTRENWQIEKDETCIVVVVVVVVPEDLHKYQI